MDDIKILFEGWRGISHSYCIVNQFQLLEFTRKMGSNIRHYDAPYFLNHWSRSNNSIGFDDYDQNIIDSISSEFSEFDPDWIYRIYAPLNTYKEKNKRLALFSVTEFGYKRDQINQLRDFANNRDGDIIVTPSNWCKNYLTGQGINPENIFVISHAVASKYYFRLENQLIEEIRHTLGYNNNDIILLNVGAPLWNKGLDILIRAFLIAAKNNDRIKLLLKGQKATYGVSTKDYFLKIVEELGWIKPDILNRVSFFEDNLNISQMNQLYNICDYYVTPYRAEGFNLPALEAVTLGKNVIATIGGASDDFLKNYENSKFISGQYKTTYLDQDKSVGQFIEPDLHELIETLLKISSRSTSSSYKSLEWSTVVEKLIDIFKGSSRI